MNEQEIKISKKVLVFGFVIVLVFTLFFFIGNLKTTGFVSQDIDADTITLEEKFAVLSKANSNSCGGTFNYVDSMPDNSRIQGSCCSVMNFHRYSEQVEGLKKFKEYEIIPKDPYDVSVSQAKEFLDYQKNIQLNSEQQLIYNEAMELSEEGGPCCCKCWHWYAYEGLAKHLIVEENFTAEQIAEVWDLSDACGGSGHVDGTGGH